MSDTSNPIAFDFDEWKAVARADPSQFLKMRQRLIEQHIQRSSPDARRRLHGLQWKIDQICNTSPTAMGACVRLSRMMWDTVLGENGLLENMQRLNAKQPTESIKSRKKAAVIQLGSGTGN